MSEPILCRHEWIKYNCDKWCSVCGAVETSQGTVVPDAQATIILARQRIEALENALRSLLQMPACCSTDEEVLENVDRRAKVIALLAKETA